MNVLSVSAQRARDGISVWASAIEEELRAVGHEVTSASYRSLPDVCDFELTIVQQETVTSVLLGELLPLLAVLHRLRGSKVIIVVHTVLRAGDLERKPLIVRTCFLIIQACIMRLLGHYGVIVALTSLAVKTLASIGIKAYFVPIGVYSGHRDHGDRVQEKIRVGVIGHPYAFKRYRLAAQAFADLPIDVRERAIFCVVGGDGERDPQEWEAIQVVLSLLPDGQVDITGPLSDDRFSEAVAALDLALIPYEERATASAVVSIAAGAGVPAIVSCASVFEFLVEGNAAVKVEAWPSEASDALRELIISRSKLDAMRSAMCRIADANGVRESARMLMDIASDHH